MYYADRIAHFRVGSEAESAVSVATEVEFDGEMASVLRLQYFTVTRLDTDCVERVHDRTELYLVQFGG